MEIFSIIIWTIVVVMFIIMMIVMIRGGNAIVYVFDEFNGIYKKKGKETNSKVSFKYNSSSKGGVAIEGNKYKIGKKKAFLYRDIGGTLLPITDTKISDKLRSLELSTSQEKLYETKAMENVVNKIDNTFWKQIQPIIVGALILMVAMIVSIVMVQKASDIEPMPEPQLVVWQETSEAMVRLVESNEKLVEAGLCNNNKGVGEPPK